MQQRNETFVYLSVLKSLLLFLQLTSAPVIHMYTKTDKLGNRSSLSVFLYRVFATMDSGGSSIQQEPNNMQAESKTGAPHHQIQEGIWHWSKRKNGIKP